jgi:hypothetical protein
MAGPVELMIVAGAFGIVGVYLYIVSRFIRAAEAETPRVEPKSQATSGRPLAQRMSAVPAISAH